MIKKKAKIRSKTKKTKAKPRRGRPKKAVKYNKTINIRLTHQQWVEVLNWAQKAHLEPSVYIRKILLDFLNIKNLL